jgi:hypothetical protein
LHQGRLADPGNTAEQGAFAASAACCIDGGAELRQLLLPVDHTTVEVKQWSGHGEWRTVVRAVGETAR